MYDLQKIQSSIYYIMPEEKEIDPAEANFASAGSGTDYAARHFDENGDEIYEVEEEAADGSADDGNNA